MLKSRTCSKQKLDRHSSELLNHKLNKKGEKKFFKSPIIFAFDFSSPT